MSEHPQNDFGDLLDQLLKERGLSVRAFARQVDVPPQTVSNAKRFSLNAQHIEAWADALGLIGGQRQRFIDLAWETHAPQQVRDRIRGLEAELDRLRIKKPQ